MSVLNYTILDLLYMNNNNIEAIDRWINEEITEIVSQSNCKKEEEKVSLDGIPFLW